MGDDGINMPPIILSFPPLASRLGTQMEFIIRRGQAGKFI